MHSLINTHLALDAAKTIAATAASGNRRRRFRAQTPSKASASAPSALSERPSRAARSHAG
jgi:hypothetical protein